MVLSFCDKSKICCINFARKLPTDFRKLEKLAALEPKVGLLAQIARAVPVASPGRGLGQMSPLSY